MLTRSLVAAFLSLPVTVVAIGLSLVLTSSTAALQLPNLLMVFPVWVSVACASYLIRKTSTAAIVLVVISIVGFGLISVLELAGIGP